MASPPITRVMRILDHLASHPDEEFTISELARRLDLNKATCHAIVTTLLEREYLRKGALSGRVQLGPALIPLGLVAEHRFRPVEVARAELNALADEFGVAVIVSIRTGNEILHLAHFGPSSVYSAMSRPGQRLPLVPPLGTTFYAWAPQQEIDEWLATLPHPDEHALHTYRSAVDRARSLGYVTAHDSALWRRLLGTVRESESDVVQPREVIEERIRDVDLQGYAVDSVGNRTVSAPIAFVSAPVFDSSGTVRLAVTVQVSDNDKLDFDQVVARLTHLTAHMTLASGGRAPSP